MPTFVFVKDGKEIHRVVGANTEQLKADIESKSESKESKASAESETKEWK